MRYIVIFLTVFATGCFGQRSGKDSKSKIDTAKLFNPNNHPDHSGAKEMNMFKRSILLTHPELYAVLNDSEYKFEAAKKLNEFLNTNKDEIQKDLFYILIDSNTAFKRIVSTLDLLKENQITDYKVINIQYYFRPPEPVTIQAPTQVETITERNDSTYFSIKISDQEITVKLDGKESKFKNIDDLDLFVTEHKQNIKDILITIDKNLPNSKSKAVLEVLRKHEFSKIYLVAK